MNDTAECPASDRDGPDLCRLLIYYLHAMRGRAHDSARCIKKKANYLWSCTETSAFFLFRCSSSIQNVMTSHFPSLAHFSDRFTPSVVRSSEISQTR